MTKEKFSLPTPRLNQKLILGLDIGTSSVRAALYDERGEILPETLVKNERSLEVTDDGGSEIDAEVALKQVVAAIDGVVRHPATRKAEITHVASCAFWHSLVGIDKNGKPTTRVFSWADTRAGEFTKLLRKRFDESKLHNRTGARFHSSFWPAKLLWLRNEYPEAFRRTSVWMSFSDFIALRLFGIAATSISMASGTGMFDIRNLGWDRQLTRFLALESGSLPLISAVSYTYGLVEKYRRRWPRLKNAEWFPAIGDGAANNIGAGCAKRSRAALMIGTSGAMRIAYRGEPPEKIPAGLWCYRVDHDRVILGGALSDGGGLFRWLQENLDLDENAEAEIVGRTPDSHGLTVLPFFSGERSTGYRENACGAILGMKSSTTPIHILHAALESVAFRFAEILDQLHSLGRVREIIASGGALRKSPVWAQIVADVLGRDLILPDSREPSMHGAVLLALKTIGKIDRLEQIPASGGTRIVTDKSHRSIYSAARRRHQEAYKLLIGQDN